jgi:hypothetical protein
VGNYDRPSPLTDAASSHGVIWSVAGALVTYLATFGVLSQTQVGSISALIAGLPAVLALIGGVVASFRTAQVAKPQVTPIADPRYVDETGALVPLVPTTGFGDTPPIVQDPLSQ